MSVDPNAPAHPCRPSEAHKGLTIRQAYAMAAMQGLFASLAGTEFFGHPGCQEVADYAFDQADAMIAHENGEVS